MSAVPTIYSGLRDPVHDSQFIFRQLLRAMSEPGVIGKIAPIKQCPKSIHPASYAVLLSLLDQDCALIASDSIDQSEIENSLKFHNGFDTVTATEEADFYLCSESDIPDFSRLNIGSEKYPDKSCTAIIQCQSFTSGQSINATGPGIQTNRQIRSSAFSENLIAQREIIVPHFPRGIDLIFTCGDNFFCLPRTTRITRIVAGGQ